MCIRAADDLPEETDKQALHKIELKANQKKSETDQRMDEHLHVIAVENTLASGESLNSG